jgi:HlyD family secretion protein
MMDAIGGFFMGFLALLLPGLVPPVAYHGYVEADYLYIAPEGTGRIIDLPVAEGESVAQGQLLFVLDDNAQRASLRAAEAREAVAEANWQNLKTGSRAAEVDVIAASLQQAEADLALARLTLERDLKLAQKGFASTAQIDGDNAKVATAEAQVAQLNAQLQVAALPARDAQLVAAEKSLEAAKADSDRARSDLATRRVSAPRRARVDRTYFRVGEVVGAGTPVMSLLPPGAHVVGGGDDYRGDAVFAAGAGDVPPAQGAAGMQNLRADAARSRRGALQTLRGDDPDSHGR